MVTAPLVSIALPVNSAVVASPVTLSGTASDAGGVSEVRVEVFDRDTSKWWGGDGVGWLDDRTQVSASLDAPVGSTDVGWEYVFDLDGLDPVSTLPYWWTAQSIDVAGNKAVAATANFTVDGW